MKLFIGTIMLIFYIPLRYLSCIPERFFNHFIECFDAFFDWLHQAYKIAEKKFINGEKNNGIK